jgi:hypothetical protein
VAVLPLLNEYVSFNSVDFSDHCKGASIAAEGVALDSTAFGDTWNESTGGLKSGTCTIEAMDDFAAGSIDATVWAAFNTGTPIAVAIKPVNTTIGTTNPELQFNVLPNQYQVGGTLGELAKKSLTYPITGAVTRDIVP